MKILINKYLKLLCRKIIRRIIFHVDKKSYNSTIKEEIYQSLKKKINWWHDAWAAQHKSTGIAYWEGYNCGYNDKEKLKPRR